MAAIECKTRIPDVPGLVPEQLTVGREFFLDCTGPWPPMTDPATARFEFRKGNEHFLKLLAMQKIDEGRIELKVTSYVTGKIDISNLKFLESGQTTELGPLSFEVKSVLDPAQPQQEPYGPFGPVVLPVPGSWWFGFTVILVVLGLVIADRVRRHLQRKLFLKKLAAFDSALPPGREFYQTLRRLKRDHGFFAGLSYNADEPSKALDETEKAFRLFVMRRFSLPAFTWGHAALVKGLKKENPVLAEEVGEKLKKLFHEFGAARYAGKVDARDAVQLAENARLLVEIMDREEPKGGR